jgi:phosphotransferase system HPr-like phosphotransfer protein
LVEKDYCDISYLEKARIYSNDYLKCCSYIHRFGALDNMFSKRLYSRLISSSHLLEDFLDYHGAKNNSRWFYYREMAASIRHLSLGGYAQQHIMSRISFYGLGDVSEFVEDGYKTLSFIKSCLSGLAPAILAEAVNLSIALPEEKFDRYDFTSFLSGEKLESDIDAEDRERQKDHIVKITSEFFKIAQEMDRFVFYEPLSIEEILELVPAKINEVMIRSYEFRVHNLQSYFDTYVIQSGYQEISGKLKVLRGYFSVVYHLLQIMGRLLHYYERHLHETSYKKAYVVVRDKLTEIVDPSMLLDRIINYAFYYVCQFLSDGQDIAAEIMDENIQKGSITLPIPRNRGFHQRPSLMVAKLVAHFGGKVEMRLGEKRFDASSVLDLQWAGGEISKEGITRVVFEGDIRALNDLEILASVNYGEDLMGRGTPLPDSLSYLRISESSIG